MKYHDPALNIEKRKQRLYLDPKYLQYSANNFGLNIYTDLYLEFY